MHRIILPNLEDGSKEEYELSKKLGEGSFGEIWAARNTKTKESVAIKLEKKSAKHPQLIYEAKILKYLRQPPASQPDVPFTPPDGVPVVLSYGSYGEYNAMVMELLGASLEAMFNYCNREFTLLTVLRIALQMLARLEYLHSRGFMHRDIKPDNFMVGLHSKAEQIYIIDFGLSKRFRLPGTHEHIQFREDKSLTGTARYASINNHRGLEQSRRDDLESLAYVLIYFMKGGKLPWQGIKASNKHQKYDLIKRKKQGISISSLCKDMPEVFAKFLTYVRQLEFKEKPDYAYMRKLFQKLYSEISTSTYMDLDWIRVYKMQKRKQKERASKQQLQSSARAMLTSSRQLEAPEQ